jgi:peptide/nickel transport system permease protein
VTVRDVPVVQAVSLFIAVTFILINLVADVATVLVVPKLRTAR